MPGYSYRTQLWSRARFRNARSRTIVQSKYIAPLSFEQYGFRWRNDDGSETTATWAAAQNANSSVSAGSTTRLRVGVDTVNDAPSQGYRLEVRVVGSTRWDRVRVEGE